MNRFLPPLSPHAARWARLAALTAGLLLLGWVILGLRPILTPILAALAIAYILNPVVTWVERRGISRLLIIAALYFFGTIALLTLGAFLLSQTLAQTVGLRENLDRYLAAGGQWLSTRAAAGATSAPAPAYVDWWAEVAPVLKKDGLSLANALVVFLAGLVTNVVNWLTLFVLLPMYSFFFLWRFNDMVRAVHDHLPTDTRASVVYIAQTADRAIASFFRGRLLVCLAVGLCTGLGWTILGVPFALPLGALAGVLNLVPFMSIIALPLALSAAYLDATQAGANWAMPVTLAAGVYALVQALESFLLSPLIESKTSGLHPITTVVALLIGGQWAGLLGMLLAIPVASTLKSLAVMYVLPEIRLAATADAEPEASDLPTADEAATADVTRTLSPDR